MTCRAGLAIGGERAPGRAMAIRRAGCLLAIAMSGFFLLALSDRETALMNEVEQKLALPAGAAPLSDYLRTYAYLRDHTVIGIYVHRGLRKDRPGRSWVERQDLPRIADGGCAVVTIFYDPSKGASPEALCNFAR